jgi:hypothetical protein
MIDLHTLKVAERLDAENNHVAYVLSGIANLPAVAAEPPVQATRFNWPVLWAATKQAFWDHVRVALPNSTRVIVGVGAVYVLGESLKPDLGVLCLSLLALYGIADFFDQVREAFMDLSDRDQQPPARACAECSHVFRSQEICLITSNCKHLLCVECALITRDQGVCKFCSEQVVSAAISEWDAQNKTLTLRPKPVEIVETAFLPNIPTGYVDIQTDNEDEQCLLCCRYKVVMAIDPCGHTATCVSCAQRMSMDNPDLRNNGKECPRCAVAVKQMIWTTD